MKHLKLIACLNIILLLHGCAAAVVGGGATAASVAIDRRTAGAMLEDETIELKAVKNILSEEELKDKVHINVTSYNSKVLVSGEAPTQELKSKVIDIVRNIDKVSHVYDEITIAAPSSLLARSSDSVITTKLKTKLIATKDMEGINIKVVTESGVVYLMGLVTHAEGDAATEVARQTGGVQKVVKLFQYTD